MIINYACHAATITVLSFVHSLPLICTLNPGEISPVTITSQFFPVSSQVSSLIVFFGAYGFLDLLFVTCVFSVTAANTHTCKTPFSSLLVWTSTSTSIYGLNSEDTVSPGSPPRALRRLRAIERVQVSESPNPLQDAEELSGTYPDPLSSRNNAATMSSMVSALDTDQHRDCRRCLLS